MTRALALATCAALAACRAASSPPTQERAHAAPRVTTAPSVAPDAAPDESSARLAALHARRSPLTRGLEPLLSIADACGTTTIAAEGEPSCLLVDFAGDGWVEATLRERGGAEPVVEGTEGLRGTVGPAGPICVAAGTSLELHLARGADGGPCAASAIVYRARRSAR